MRRKRVWIAALAGAGLVAGLAGGLWARDTETPEFERLAGLLEIGTGSRVAEIGAGKGAMALRAAEKVGPSGRVFATEVEEDKLDAIHRGAENRRIGNITVLEGGETDTALAEGCCDAVYMRKVYHHITHPAEINRSIHRALVPGGRVAVIDFPPRFWLAPWKPKGVPKNRGGHGVPLPVVIEEMRAAGFDVVQVVAHWPGVNYCVVFRKR